jgi:hypothetical protein
VGYGKIVKKRFVVGGALFVAEVNVHIAGLFHRNGGSQFLVGDVGAGLFGGGADAHVVGLADVGNGHIVFVEGHVVEKHPGTGAGAAAGVDGPGGGEGGGAWTILKPFKPISTLNSIYTLCGIVSHKAKNPDLPGSYLIH